MPKFRPIQNSFAAGAVSPLLDLRSDTKGYKQGLREAVNVLATSRGPARGRTGLEFLAEIPGVTYGRVFSFERNENDTYVVVATDDQVYVLDETGNLRSDNFVTTDFDFDKPFEWNEVTNGGQSSVQFAGSICTLTNGTQTGQWAEVQFTGSTGLGIFAQTPGNDSELILLQLTDQNVNIRIGSTAGDNDYFDFIENGEVINISYLAPAASYFVTFRTVDASSVVELDKWAVYDITANPGVLSFASPWSEFDISQLQEGMVPNKRGGAKEQFFVTGGVFPQQLFVTNDNTWAFQDVSWDTDTGSYPTGSGTSPWNSLTSNPKAITFSNTRTFLAGQDEYPGTLIATKIDETAFANTNYIDFRTGSTSADNDPIEADRTEEGAIMWLASGKQLFMGTSKREDVVESTGPNLTPTDITARGNSAEGGALIQPRKLGTQLFFVSSERNRINSFDYVRGRDGYTPVDITFAAEHLFLNYSILELTSFKGKERIIIAVLENGTAAAGVYNQDTDTIGWTVIETNGQIISMTEFVSNGIHQIAALVKRNGKLYVEFWKPDDPVYLDSYVTVRSETLTTQFFGFDHLANQTVGVIADGWTQADVTVGSDGSIVLQEPALEVSAGYHYSQRIKTLPYDTKDKEGSTRSKIKHHNKIYVATLNSAEPLINGKRPPTRQLTTNDDTADPILHGTVYQRVANLGRDRFAEIEVEQDLPYPLTVLGIFNETDVTGT
jgi:hypothetical protein